MTIKLFTHHVYQESIDNVTEVLRSGWTGLGPKTEEFERVLAKYLDTPHAITFNSGTSALEAAVACLAAPKGSYVITTPLTFIATNHVILRAGLLPVFADIEFDTGNIDAESIKRLLSNPFIKDRVKAFMPVHYGGLPVDMDTIYDLANENKIDVIEDAAHAFGAMYKNDKIGTKFSRYCCFSFHSVKPFAIGDGGLLTTYADDVDKIVRLLKWFGIDKTTSDRFTKDGYKWDYDVRTMGYKTHMNDIQAAIGLGQFLHYEDDRKKRQAIANRYRERLESNDRLTVTNTRPGRTSANYLFVILCISKEMKDALMQFLYDNEIQTGCHYRPNHLYKMYKQCETDNGCKNAMEFFEKAISLPLHVDLSMGDVDHVCDKIYEFTGKV